MCKVPYATVTLEFKQTTSSLANLTQQKVPAASQVISATAMDSVLLALPRRPVLRLLSGTAVQTQPTPRRHVSRLVTMVSLNLPNEARMRYSSICLMNEKSLVTGCKFARILVQITTVVIALVAATAPILHKFLAWHQQPF